VSSFDRSLPRQWPRPGSAGETGRSPLARPAVAGSQARSAGAAGLAAEPDLTWPFVIVLVYFFVDFARPQSWLPPLGLLKPGVIALGGGLLTLLARRELLYFPTRAKLMGAFLVLMAIGTPFATNRYWAFLATKDFGLFLFGAVVPLMSFVNTYSRLQRLISAVILIHVPLALYGITHSGFGIGSFLGDENDFCLAVNIIVPYVFFSFYFTQGGLRRFSLLMILGLLLLAITSTLSRGGFLGLIAVGVYCWMASSRKLASLLLIAVVSLPVLALVPQSYWNEMKTIQTATENDDTGAQRLYYWNIAWEMFKDHPIVGVGPTNYQYNSFEYESADQQAKGLNVWGRAAHSLYFTLLAELGIVGVVLVVSLVIFNFRENRAVRRLYKALQASGTTPPARLQQFYILNVLTRANDAAMVAYLVTGAFLSVLYYPHFWLQIGIGIAIKRAADNLMAEECVPAQPPAPRVRAWSPRPARA
jgi:probable O-glycosylation ligase (exosortase A-associated)